MPLQLGTPSAQAPPAAPAKAPLRVRVEFSRALESDPDMAAVMVLSSSGSSSEGEGATAMGWGQPQAKAGGHCVVFNPQLRRARALFPCADNVGLHATFDMHITVPPEHTAVCGGELRSQVLCALEPAQALEGLDDPNNMAGEEGIDPVSVKIWGHWAGRGACVCARMPNCVYAGHGR